MLSRFGKHKIPFFGYLEKFRLFEQYLQSNSFFPVQNDHSARSYVLVSETLFSFIPQNVYKEKPRLPKKPGWFSWKLFRMIRAAGARSC